ncbi:MAG: ABC transporter ATP-binding protein, partial [Lactococcus raffinolactis]|nr:ABC transporter ATP-binding protein [Lactococcus raffinolactis]
MIRLKSVNKFYKQGATSFHVLKDISFKIDAGEFVSIMGPSGSGKSTLINIVGFLDDQFEGEYWFMDDNIQKKSRRDYAILRNQSVGFVFQNFKLIDTLSVAENIGLPLIYAGKRRKAIRSEVQQVLSQVGLPDLGTKKPRDLSG